jgi:hypothetical protein
MNYEEIARLCQQLGYRDKLRLAQLLIQLARKEEESQNPQHHHMEEQPKEYWQTPDNAELIQYVLERIVKLKPTKLSSLKNSIEAMFQFQGGISEFDQEKIISELQRLKYIRIDENNKVKYL